VVNTLKSYSAQFPGRFEYLATISEFIVKAAEEAGFNENEIYSIQLAADEAASNIIEHAYGGENRGKIECTCSITNENLTIIFKDYGTSFDPDQVPALDTTLPLEQRTPGGAGLFLMRKLMDEVNFEFSSKEGNTLILVKKRK